MDLTPLDVRKKKDDLRRTVRGYESTQVDAFLDLVADRLEEVVQEEVRLREQVTMLRERLGGFEDRERALNEALIAAQELREEARLQAEKQAGLRLQEAAQQAEQLVSDARRSAEDSERALADLHARRASFLRGMRSLLGRFLDEVGYEEARLAGTPKAVELPVEADEDVRMGNRSPTTDELSSAPRECRQPGRRGPRSMGRRGHLSSRSGGAACRSRVRILRGAADGERQAGRAPLAGADDQGHGRPIQSDDRLARHSDRRLGHARPSRGDRGREAARDLGEARDRAHGDRPVQPGMPRQPVYLQGRLGASVPAHRLLARLRERLRHLHAGVHRVRLVGSFRDSPEGTPVQGIQGPSLLSPVWDRALQSRGGAGIPRRLRALGLREVQARGRSRECVDPELDDDSVDPPGQRRFGRRGGNRLPPGPDSGAAGRREEVPERRQAGRGVDRGIALAPDVLRHPYDIVDVIPGADLVGRRYEPLFPGAVDAQDNAAAWTVLEADFVTTEDGTGVVHTAVMYGEDDFALGVREDLPMEHTVDPDGRFVGRVPGGLAGRFVKDPETDQAIIDGLAEADLLYRRRMYEHTYPHCWRCDSALLYMARDSWYIRTTAVRDRLLEHNASVDWHPPEMGSGRMGEWLSGNVDWAVSRDRYWGTPLPIWVCDADPTHIQVVGSLGELANRAPEIPADFDPHRPEIDELSWPCEEPGCAGALGRVPQVMDAWFDSGSMPFAQWHYPFENEEEFEAHFPAHFIAEGVDQTRGWFYSLLAISTLVFDSPSYRSVIVNDLILDEDGQKMSKSKGNVVDPWETVSEYGADATRFYLLSSSNPWLPKKWDGEALKETNRKLFDTLRSTYRFFAMYAELEGWDHEARGASAVESRAEIDRWLLSRVDDLVSSMSADFEAYDLTRAARRVATFVLDDLSNWYVRQSRDRFWATGGDVSPSDRTNGTADAFATLHSALATTALVLAPISPFLSDWLHRHLTGRSAHLADFPEPLGRRDEDLERRMDDVRRLSTLGRAAREEAGLRVRQPLASLQAVIPGGHRPGPELEAVLRQELNVKEVVFPSGSDDIVRLSAKPDFAKLGPRFGARTPRVAKAIKDLDPGAVRRLGAGEVVTVSVDGETLELQPGDARVLEEASGDLMIQAHEGFLVGLDTAVTPELEAEGLAREIVSRVQRLRRESGLDVSDRIRLGLAAGTGRLVDAVTTHRDYIAGETLALAVTTDVDETEAMKHTAHVKIEGENIALGLSRTDG